MNKHTLTAIPETRKQGWRWCPSLQQTKIYAWLKLKRHKTNKVRGKRESSSQLDTEKQSGGKGREWPGRFFGQ